MLLLWFLLKNNILKNLDYVKTNNDYETYSTKRMIYSQIVTKASFITYFAMDTQSLNTGSAQKYSPTNVPRLN